MRLRPRGACSSENLPLGTGLPGREACGPGLSPLLLAFSMEEIIVLPFREAGKLAGLTGDFNAQDLCPPNRLVLTFPEAFLGGTLSIIPPP